MKNIVLDLPKSLVDLKYQENNIYYFDLFNCIEDNEYLNKIKNLKGYKILGFRTDDIFKKQNVREKVLVNVAEELDVNEIILPYDSVNSRNSLKSSLNFLQTYGNRLREKNIKFIGMVKAKNLADYISVIKKLYNNQYINSIMIPYDLYGLQTDDISFLYNKKEINLLNRLMLVKYMFDNQMVDKSVYLFEIGNPIELFYLKDYSFVNNVITRNPVVVGFYSERYDNLGNYNMNNTNIDIYNNITVSDDQLKAINDNIKKLIDFNNGILNY